MAADEKWRLRSLKLSSTRYSEIVFYVLTVVLSYSLYHLFANTRGGRDLPTRRVRRWPLKQLRTQRTHVIVYARGLFELVRRLRFLQMMLNFPPVRRARYSRS